MADRIIYSPNFSIELQDQLRFEEGVRNFAYPDPVNKAILTIGVGHNLIAAPCWPDNKMPISHSLTDAEVSKLLEFDLLIADEDLGDCYITYKRMPASPRKDALLAMAFQLGVARFMKFVHMRMHIDHGMYELAYQDGLASQWAKQCTARANRVLRQFLRNEYYEVPLK